MGLSYSGNFVFDKVEIISAAGDPIEVGQQVVQITIFEDTFNAALHGEIIFNDNFNLQNKLPLIGQEFLRLKIKTPAIEDDEDTIDFSERVFALFQLSNSTIVNENNQMHTMKFISMEHMRNQRVKISRTLEGTYSDIVTQIMKRDLSTTKNMWIEPSSGLKRINALNDHPMDIIRQLRTQAVTMQNSSPTYLFFESMWGYHFRSIESLYAEWPVAYYTVLPEGQNIESGVKQLALELSKIKEFSISSRPNTLANQKDGTYGSTLIVHDIFSKTYSTHTYNYFDAFDREKHINSYHGKKQAPIFSKVGDLSGKRLSDQPSKLYLSPTSIYGDGSDAHATNENGQAPYEAYKPEQWLQRRTSQISQLDGGIILTVIVDGNTTIHAGDIVEVEVPYNAWNKDSKKENVDKFFRGPFFIKALRHDFNSPTRTHEMTLTLVKDCIDEELPSSVTSPEPETKGGRVHTNFYEALSGGGAW